MIVSRDTISGTRVSLLNSDIELGDIPKVIVPLTSFSSSTRNNKQVHSMRRPETQVSIEVQIRSQEPLTFRSHPPRHDFGARDEGLPNIERA